MTAKTPNERQKTFKKRQQAAGLKELRNLWALPEHHERIKAFANQLTKPSTTKGQRDEQ